MYNDCVIIFQNAPHILKRWVPFVAVASANCINIPIMRQRELVEGMTISDSDGNVLGKSRVIKLITCTCVHCSSFVYS